MVAHVLRLRLDLLLGALRGDARHVAGAIVGVVLVAAAVVAVFLAGDQLQDAGRGVAHAVTVALGSALTFGFFVAAAVGGADDQLDPRRFVVFGLAPRAVAGAVLVAGILSVPVLGLIAVGAAVARLWIGHGAPVGLTVLAVALGVLTCMLSARVAQAIGALLLRARRSRELSGAVFVVLVAAAVPVVVFVASLRWNGRVPPALEAAVDVLALTPLSAAWAIPGTQLQGSSTAPLVVAILTVAVLAAAWMLLAQRLLTTTERPVSGRERAGLGWFALAPGTPAGGVAARSLIYWLRDPRYVVNLVIVPVLAAIVVVPLLVVGVPVAYVALVPAPLMALFFGWIAHNDLAYDSTAVWMHVASAMRGASDRIGRLVPALLVGGATLAVIVPVSVSLHGRWATLPAMAGVCTSLFLCGLGLSSISSVAAPYAASRPGDSPFQQPQRTTGGLAQGAVLIGAVLLSAPALWWAWLSLTVDPGVAWTALWVGASIGMIVLVVGVLGGGAVFDRSGGRLMEFAEST